jgi:hypothetical protein
MAERDKVQLNVQIAKDTRELLRKVCEERGAVQGDVVNAALQQWLAPAEEADDPRTTVQRLMALEAGVVEVRQAIEALIVVLQPAPTPQASPQAKPKVATYEDMYGPIEHGPAFYVAPPAPPTPPRRWWQRWLYREETA